MTPEPWFPRHPLGGVELYADAETNEPLATFRNEEDCERARKCVNACAGIADPVMGIAIMRKVLHDMSTGSVPRSDMRSLATHALNTIGDEANA